MEYFDVLNSRGKQLGKSKARKEVHKDGDWHESMIIWIVNSKGELLIQKRAAGKDSYANYWDVSCGGHLLSGENSIDAAKRELKEELGLQPEGKEFEYLFTIKEQHITNNNTFIDNEYLKVYLIFSDLNLSKMKLQKEEVSEVKFVHYKELEKIIKNKEIIFTPHKEQLKKLFIILKKRFN